ncbi:MAG: hypothetical protein LBC80_01225 [Treponema sp.]|nr:hypothetical protein [Treponema sp.]
MVGLILGILAIALPWFVLNLPILVVIAILCGALGIFLSFKDMQKLKAANQPSTKPLIGLILSIAGLVIALPLLWCCFRPICSMACDLGLGMGWMFGGGVNLGGFF